MRVKSRLRSFSKQLSKIFKTENREDFESKFMVGENVSILSSLSQFELMYQFCSIDDVGRFRTPLFTLVQRGHLSFTLFLENLVSVFCKARLDCFLAPLFNHQDYLFRTVFHHAVSLVNEKVEKTIATINAFHSDSVNLYVAFNLPDAKGFTLCTLLTIILLNYLGFLIILLFLI